MKTLLVVSHSSLLRGGGEEDYLRLIKFLYGKYNLIGVFPEGENVNEYKKYVSEYLIIPDKMFPFTEFRIKNYLGYLIKASRKYSLLKSYLRDKKIDLAYIHSSVCIYEVFTINKLNIPYILAVREFINPVSVRERIYRYYLNSAKKIIVISKELKKEFFKLDPTENKVELIYPGIENNSDLNPSPIINTDNTEVVLAIGNISPQKGHHKIIEAFSKLKESGKNIILKIIGENVDEKYYKYINSLIDIFKLKNKIIFTGGLPREKVLEEISNAKIVIISSQYEGFSLVLLEALSLRKPVISTKVGVIPEVIIDRVNGLLYDFHDSKKLAEKIDLLIDDDILYEKISLNGYETFRSKFSLTESLDKHECVIKKILNAIE